METVKHQSNERVTLIDAGTLDEDQFNQLMSNIDARHPAILYLFCLLLVFAAFTIIT